MKLKHFDSPISRLQSSDINSANKVFRLAFGSQFGYAEPEKFAEGFTLGPRFIQEPAGVFGAFLEGELIAVATCSSRGSVGVFGPVAVKPQFWGGGIGKKLTEFALDYFSQRGILNLGLSTFPESPKHVSMYSAYGYFPRTLIASMCKIIDEGEGLNQRTTEKRFSELSSKDKDLCLVATQEITDRIFQGLSYNRFIEVADQLKIGDTLLIYDNDLLAGFAVCHYGIGSEAELNVCYIKAAAILPSSTSTKHFCELLKACERFAKSKQAIKLFGGINTAREEAFKRMLSQDFKIESLTVSMHNPNQPFYDRPYDYVIDDWR